MSGRLSLELWPNFPRPGRWACVAHWVLAQGNLTWTDQQDYEDGPRPNESPSYCNRVVGPLQHEYMTGRDVIPVGPPCTRVARGLFSRHACQNILAYRLRQWALDPKYFGCCLLPMHPRPKSWSHLKTGPSFLFEDTCNHFK
jgi:hypothetical protein